MYTYLYVMFIKHEIPLQEHYVDFVEKGESFCRVIVLWIAFKLR